MRVISKRPFSETAECYPNQRQAILDVYSILKRARFDSPAHMRQVFPRLYNFKDREKWWVVNIGGNHLRMMAFIQFNQNRINVKHIVTHAEYDKLCEHYRKGSS
jgi:mRNA interferase HigB